MSHPTSPFATLGGQRAIEPLTCMPSTGTGMSVQPVRGRRARLRSQALWPALNGVARSANTMQRVLLAVAVLPMDNAGLYLTSAGGACGAVTARRGLAVPQRARSVSRAVGPGGPIGKHCGRGHRGDARAEIRVIAGILTRPLRVHD